MDRETQELIDYFLSESRDTIQEVEPLLIQLEAGGYVDDETLARIFRLFHSMKGTAGFLDLQSIERVTHSAETVLQRLREGGLALTQCVIDALCETLDFISERLDRIETTGTDAGAEPHAEALVGRLGQLVSQELCRGGGAVQAGPGSEQPARGESGAALRAAGAAAGGGAADAAGGERAPSASMKRAQALQLDDGGGVVDSRLGDSLGLSIEISPAIFQQYMSEAEDLLSEIEQGLLALDDESATQEMINDSFGALHSIKGNSGFLGFSDIEALAHCAESAVIDLKGGHYGATPDMVAALLSIVDAIRKALQKLPGEEPSIPDRQRLAARLQEAVVDARSTAAPRRSAALPASSSSLPQSAPSAPAATPAASEPSAPAATPAASEPSAPAATPADARSSLTAKRRNTLRVDVEKLDLLMDLVGELIIGVTSVLHNPKSESLGAESFQKSATQLDRITRDLQDVAMSLRMVPIDGTFRKMIRLVRDVSRKKGKRVHLEISGSETEVDKTIAEAIADPLVHIMRNAVDHGVEDAEERAAAGKPEEAHISLSARHRGGEIWISIADDGRGIDRARILSKARARGLPGADREDMSDSEVFAFIFEPGFSTAGSVTDISGRGIGMDVVKRNIERVGGRVEIESRLGEGTTITLRIPLTLAIIEGMLLRVGTSYFTIPLLQIVESVVLQPKHIITLSNGQEIARVRDRMIPVLRLHRFYGIEPSSRKIEDGIFLIVEDGDAVACLLVDELIGQRQTVVKSLSGYLGDLRGLSGCTVLGDGCISLIIDIQNLLQHHARRVA